MNVRILKTLILEMVEQEGLMYEGDDSILEAFSGATLEEGDLVCEGCLFEMLQEASCARISWEKQSIKEKLLN